MGEPAPGVRARPGLGTAAVLSSMGLFVVALAGRVNADRGDLATTLFWVGLVVTALPFAVVAVRPATPRPFRVAAVVGLTVALFLVRVMFEPLRFQGVDELQQLRSLLDIARTHHLFEPNPLVSSYPKFPGLLLVTDALSRISGCSTYVAGLVVVGVARLLLVAALFRLAELMLGTHRRAAVVVLVYLCNPNFIFFGTEFGYESFALPLAVTALLAAAQLAPGGQRLPARRLPATLLVVVLCAAVVVSHHMTAIWLTVEMLLWLGLGLLLARRRPLPALWPAVACTALTAVWIGVVARAEIAHELGPTFHSSWQSLVDLVKGGSGAKRPFSGAPQQLVDPLGLRLFGFASVAVLCLLLLVGMVSLLRKRVRAPLLVALTLPALLYPVSLVLRLTSASTETASRSAEFVFFGLALLAGLVARLGRRSRTGYRPPAIVRPALAASATFVVLLIGGVVIGTAPYDRYPRGYRPSANGSSITVPGLLAAQWAGRALPHNSYVVADQANRLLMGSYGGLHPQLGLADSVPVGHLLLDSRLTADAVAVVKVDKVAYLVADARLARALPATGNYVDGSEPDAGHHNTPLPESALTKFDHVAGVSRIYDNGVIRIYDVTGLQRSLTF